MLNTDGNGDRLADIAAALAQSGATNAWVFIEGPPEPGQIRGEFYASDILTSLN